jgi:hypothetical protein
MEGMTKRDRFIRFTSSLALPVPSAVEGSAVKGPETGHLRTCGNCGKLNLLPDPTAAIGVSLAEIAEIAKTHRELPSGS